MRLSHCPLFLAASAVFFASASAELLSPQALYQAKMFTSLEEAAKAPAEVRRLQLGPGSVKAFPPEILQMTNLQELQINGCKELTALPPGIAKLTSLQRLDVNGNGLTALPPELGKCAELTKLQCGGNPLTTLPDELGALKKLRALEIVGVKFTAIPACVFQMSALADLNLNSNPIETVAPGIGNLTNLETLGLMYGAFPTLPPEIGKLGKLSRLLLVSGKLSSLPPEIGRLAQLSELSISTNEVTALPAEITGLTALTDIDFGSNPIADLPATFALLGKLPNLSSVRFDAPYNSGEPLAVPDAVATWKSVRTLSFSSHKLKDPAAVLKKLALLPRLSSLNLSQGKLGVLPPEIGQLAALETLRLEGNGLKALPDSFKALKKLRYLYAGSDNAFTPAEKAKWKAALPEAKLDMGN